MASKGKNFNWRGKEFARKIDNGLMDNMKRAAIFLQGSIQVAFPHSGTIGTRSGGGNPKNPSKPGEIPHVQQGHLKRNIGWEVKRKPGEIIGRVGTGIGNKQSVGYALALEFGRKDGSILARPFLRRGLKRERAKLRKILGQKIV